MRKTINIAALIFFIWLLLGVYNIQDIFLNFLLVGEIPVIKTSLPPSVMLAIFTIATIVILFEVLARRFETIQRTRQSILSFTHRLSRRPNRA